MRTLLVTAAVLTLLVLLGPGATSASGTASSVTVKNSAYGRILFDGRGFVLYGFTRDPKGHSVCTGACAKAWPPFLVPSAPDPGAGTSGSLIGTTRRGDGRLQATYAGRPLYYYVGDRKPGQILCQNVVEFGGRWLVVRATGRLVR